MVIKPSTHELYSSIIEELLGFLTSIDRIRLTMGKITHSIAIKLSFFECLVAMQNSLIVIGLKLKFSSLAAG